MAVQTLQVFNTLSKRKEAFEPLHAPHVGMYVCGPTVYGDAHLGHARPAITFDIVYRYLEHLGYRVRYVRNITDVGHLESDSGEGEDKIAKKARLDQLEPMEVVKHFTDRYHQDMLRLNTLPPSIEPCASGHIIEQIQMVEAILEKGLAYEVNGSVYFDVRKYAESAHYGELSGRVLDDLMDNTRTLDGQDEKRNGVDFALWKKASPEHIMRWPSPWGEGFPGWHLECSAMSTKYLGNHFDIHGGGADLLFPHHECEIAQSRAANECSPAKYWLHNNMITINGQKMGKSLGNFINLKAFFSGDHELLDKAYSPMTIRFFILQAHYRSTLDFSNEALSASEKGYKRLGEALKLLLTLPVSDQSDVEVAPWEAMCFDAMNDDFNTPMLLAKLFEAVKWVHGIAEGNLKIDQDNLNRLKQCFDLFVSDILGLTFEDAGDQHQLVDGLMNTIISLRQEARATKNYAFSDKIRDELHALQIAIHDGKEGTTWTYEG